MKAIHIQLLFSTLPRESYIAFFAAAIAIGTISILWRFKKSPEVKYIIFIEVFTAIWAVTYGMEFSTPLFESKVFWSQMSYFGFSFLPLVYFLFTTAFSQRNQIISPLKIAFLSIIPFFTLPLVFTNDYHHLVWAEVIIAPGLNMILYKYGLWFWIFWSYSATLVLAGLYNLFRSIYEFTDYYKTQVKTLVIATLIPFLGNVMYVSGLNPVAGFDWTPVLFIFSGLVITFGVVRYRMFDLVPFVRNILIDNMRDGVIVVNSEGFIEDCNQAVYPIFTLRNKPIIRKSFAEVFEHYKSLVNALKEKEKKLVEITTGEPDNPSFYQARISPVYNNKQQFSGHLVQINDITSLKNTETKLKKANQQLKTEVENRGRLIEDLDAFAHTVAHDLRNSLGAVFSSGEIIRESIREGETESLVELADLIKDAAQKAIQITHELLILASVNHQKIEKETLDMAYIFSNAKKQVIDLLLKSQAHIIEPESWPESTGYPPWVEEIWVNYLTNAVKYGGTPSQITVGAEKSGKDTAKFWIKDNGNGISPGNQHRLFQKYARLAPLKADGYGLGLSIVKRIVEKLDGTVGVESTGAKGEGAKFWFELPACQTG